MVGFRQKKRPAISRGAFRVFGFNSRADAGEISPRLHRQFADAVVNHAGHLPARGGDAEHRLAPVRARVTLHHARRRQHAEVFAEIHRRAAGNLRAVGDAQFPAIGEQLDDGPAERAAQRGHHRDGIERGHGIGGRNGGIRSRMRDGVAHGLSIGRIFRPRKANVQGIGLVTGKTQAFVLKTDVRGRESGFGMCARGRGARTIGLGIRERGLGVRTIGLGIRESGVGVRTRGLGICAGGVGARIIGLGICMFPVRFRIFQRHFRKFQSLRRTFQSQLRKFRSRFRTFQVRRRPPRGHRRKGGVRI